MSDGKWVLLAHLVRPQGRRGELLADLLTDFPERFKDRKRVFLVTPAKAAKPGAAPPREIGLEDHWLHKGRVVLKFAGIDSINDAEPLRGLDVAIPFEERAPLEEDAVYISDLLGCVVYDVAAGGAGEVGAVMDVDSESTAIPLLVVKRAVGDEALIPFAKAYLKKMDVAGKRIEMALPKGLLEVNAPLTEEERRELHASQNVLEDDNEAASESAKDE